MNSQEVGTNFASISYRFVRIHPNLILVHPPCLPYHPEDTTHAPRHAPRPQATCAQLGAWLCVRVCGCWCEVWDGFGCVSGWVAATSSHTPTHKTASAPRNKPQVIHRPTSKNNHTPIHKPTQTHTPDTKLHPHTNTPPRARTNPHTHAQTHTHTQTICPPRIPSHDISTMQVCVGMCGWVVGVYGCGGKAV